MNKPTSLADTETVIELFSSHAIRALKEKKKFRRRLVIAVFTIPKILAVLYFGYAQLADTGQATAADIHVGQKAAVPFIP
jgi:hypothetical protein